MPDIRCDMCDEPMHRYGWPSDADRHDASLTACVNTLTSTRDELVRLVRQAAGRGDDDCRRWLERRAMSGQGMRYPHRFQEGDA